MSSKYSNKKVSEKGKKFDYKRISVDFVNSLFTQALKQIKAKDPLNTNYYYTTNKQILFQKTPHKNNKARHVEKFLFSSKQKGSKNMNKNRSMEKNFKNSQNEKDEKLNNSNKKKLQFNTASKSDKKKDLNSQNSNTKYMRNIDASKSQITYNSINENYLAKRESEKEKKTYQEKVRILENRVQTLKNQNEDLNRKINRYKERQLYLDRKKKEKEDMKKARLSYDIDKRNELDLKKKTIKELRDNLNKHLKFSYDKIMMIKSENYKKMKNESQIASNKINENNKILKNHITRNVNKIKKGREQIKLNDKNKLRFFEKTSDNFYLETYEDNKKETDMLKNKLKELEKLELKYINTLNQTKQEMMRNNSELNKYDKREVALIEKIDLEKQTTSKPFSSSMHKRKYKHLSVEKYE